MRDTVLDLRGLKCPLPALIVRRALARLTDGSVLVAECTDPMAAIDIPNLVRETGDVIEETRPTDKLIVFRIRRVQRR